MSVSRMFTKIGFNWILYYSDKHLDYKITPDIDYSNWQKNWNDANKFDKFLRKYPDLLSFVYTLLINYLVDYGLFVICRYDIFPGLVQ